MTDTTLTGKRRQILEFIAEHTGAPVALIGVGPGREQTVWTDAGRATIIGANSLRPDA